MTSLTAPRVDVNVPRFNQTVVAVLTGLAFVLQWWPLVAAVALVLTATRLAGPQYGLFTQVYLRAIRPRLHGMVITEDARPPAFAQALGALFLAVATLLFVLGWTVGGWAITLVVFALAALAAATRICVGCILYELTVAR